MGPSPPPYSGELEMMRPRCFSLLLKINFYGLLLLFLAAKIIQAGDKNVENATSKKKEINLQYHRQK